MLERNPGTFPPGQHHGKPDQCPPCSAWRTVPRCPCALSGRHCGVSSQGRCLALYQPKDGGHTVIGHRGPHFHSHFQGLRSNPGELCSHCFLLEEEVWLCFTLPTSAKDPGAWKYPETVLCSRDGLVKQMTVALTSVSPAKLC